MATSHFFNNFTNSQEQLLIENLVIESIKIYGVDVLYLERTVQKLDKIYGEDRQTSLYNKTLGVEMYIKNVEGFGGDGDFLSKFNLQIRDQITFTVAVRTFANEVGKYSTLTRPREGDLIYFPLNRKVFQINFVEHEPVFYQMGALQMYDLKCELFEYNGEVFATGNPEIDALYDENFIGQATIFDLVLSDRTNSMFVTTLGDRLATGGRTMEEVDSAAENETLQTEANEFLDFSEANPFSESGRF